MLPYARTPRAPSPEPGNCVLLCPNKPYRSPGIVGSDSVFLYVTGLASHLAYLVLLYHITEPASPPAVGGGSDENPRVRQVHAEMVSGLLLKQEHPGESPARCPDGTQAEYKHVQLYANALASYSLVLLLFVLKLNLKIAPWKRYFLSVFFFFK